MNIDRGLYGLLLQAIEQGRQQRVDAGPGLNAVSRDPNFRQLSRAPFAERLQNAEHFDLEAAASADQSGVSAGVPWTFNRSSMTAMPVGFRGTLVRRPGPMPPPSSTGPEYTPQPGSTPQHAISEGLKRWGLLFGLMHELQRERLMGELDDGMDQEAAADPITELEIGWRGKGARRRRNSKVPPSINGKKPHVPSPPIAPDAPGEPLGGRIGAGGGDDHERCKRAASGSFDTWNEYCNSLPTPALRARCRSSAYSLNLREGWCGALYES